MTKRKKIRRNEEFYREKNYQENEKEWEEEWQRKRKSEEEKKEWMTIIFFLKLNAKPINIMERGEKIPTIPRY